MSILKVDKLYAGDRSTDSDENLLLNDDGTTNLKGNTTVTGTCTATTFSGSGANLTNLPASGKGKNLFINGQMSIDQRRSGAAEDYDTSAGKVWIVDRFFAQEAGTDNRITVQQVDVAADTDPWNAGFRKAGKVTNGDQSAAGADDNIPIHYKFEAQDIAQSGWDYTSASSYVTFSFWVKSSVAFDLPYYFRSRDGSARMYSSTETLAANTWKKVTKAIPGDPGGLQMDTDTAANARDRGLELLIAPFYGTAGTEASGSTLNAWKAWTSTSRWNHVDTDWWDTNDATLEFTGFKLEVGNGATDYDFKTHDENLADCQRYYQVIAIDNAAPITSGQLFAGDMVSGTVQFFKPFRAEPSMVKAGGTDWLLFRYTFPGNGANNTIDGDDFSLRQVSNRNANLWFTSFDVGNNDTMGSGGTLYTQNSGALLAFEAEI